MWSGPDGVIAIYRRTKKPKDLWWNEWVARPPAAVLVYLLRGTRLTPNQVTFLSLLVALLADGVFLLWRGYFGLVAGALLVELAFILDCADGQLARIRGTSSQVGAYLDFLMDEVKAVALVAALAGRLGWQALERSGPPAVLDVLLWLGIDSVVTGVLWLALGLVGVVVVASGISLTTFMRRPEYVATGRAAAPGGAAPGRRSLLAQAIAACEWAGHSVVNYPAWLWLPAVLGRIEWFLVPYLLAHFLYLGRAGLAVVWRLGR